MSRSPGSLSPESVRPREAGGHKTAGAAAGAKPRCEIGLGANTVLALSPRQAVGEAEHSAIGEPARSIALQDDAAAARHQRDLVELDDQQLAVVAHQSDGVAAFRLHAVLSDRTLARGQYLLAGTGLRHRLLPAHNKAAPVICDDEQLHAAPVGEHRDDV